MRSFTICIAALIGITALPGCCPNGCFIVTGEAFQKAANPTPYLDQWVKPGSTKEQLLQTSEACGGGYGDRPGFSDAKVAKAMQSGESERDAYRRLFHDYERCLIRKGYKFIGPCYDNEVSRQLPRCGAP